ncbi:hypothetical protein FOB58_001342 [Candida parapsilosis]|uniref:PSP domain-containing protein n=2 Tax=Candida parapsilosis TaxID=5480 RepID=G8BEW9_CANPC|nr:uncharacterized protein CPAR2_200700 [Candida parapsilosis]KAF6055420.1 hypothetical protein FOB58_001342 [Candida parapsilosis]KAF6055557.1 hypothetical protein FOB59_000069 [Candida parapsilosis]KAF6058487.1 hypothetical protein FOB60_000069 [Candida parapsilosis]KAF6067244.1 hypothetical protein FOB61_000069 [Candida parapsilosis]KAI5903873.1 Pre-mRNA-splicing factor [Candida parapsilosis]
MSVKRSKNQIRRERLKKRRLEEQQNEETNESKAAGTESEVKSTEPEAKTDHDGSIHDIKIDENDPLLQQFQSVLKKFTPMSQKQDSQLVEVSNGYQHNDEEYTSNESDEDEQAETTTNTTLSKRQLRLRNKVSLASLKMSTHRPEIVEPTDADAQDPYLLVFIKSQPNIIPVPSHWSSKRDYLSSKRGVERPSFQLPKFIRDTGIEEMRSTTTSSDDRTLKQQQRERVQVKLGRLDMDYEKLYRAFFHHQSKPRLSKFGELYEEGKELVDELTNEAKKMRPGVVSKTLRQALGMNDHDLNIAPAWITIMKDIGKPPSYQDLIIPGIDEDYNNSGYRDKHSVDGDVRVEHWGRIKTLVESESEGEEEDDEREDEDEDEGGEEDKVEEEEEDEDEDEDEDEEEEEEKNNKNNERETAQNNGPSRKKHDSVVHTDSDSDEEDKELPKKSSLKDVLFNIFGDENAPDFDSKNSMGANDPGVSANDSTVSKEPNIRSKLSTIHGKNVAAEKSPFDI